MRRRDWIATQIRTCQTMAEAAESDGRREVAAWWRGMRGHLEGLSGVLEEAVETGIALDPDVVVRVRFGHRAAR